MEFILISDNKMKVMLTEEDLREFDIEAEELDYSNTDTKKMFWDVLSRAKHSTGFDTDGQKVLVQLYPSRHGGCEMFVTKIGSLSHGGDSCQYVDICDDADGISIKKPQRPKVTQKRRSAFGFDKLSDLLSVCRQLSSIDYSAPSTAFVSNDNRYFLTLEGIDTSAILSLSKFSFICEFGYSENKDSLDYYLKEYGKLICSDNAVNILSEL